MLRLIAIGLVLAASARAADVLKLDDAIAIALENNRNLQSSALNVAKAREQLAATRTRQFPGINLYALGAQQLQSYDVVVEGVHMTTPIQPTGTIISQVKQPLSSLIRIHRNMDMLKTGVKLAQEQTRSDRQKLTREVKRVYYSLQQVESSLRSVRETTILYQEIAKLTSNYVLQEVALRGDLLDAQTRLARSEQLDVQLRNQEAASKEQLNLLLGRDFATEFNVQPVLEAKSTEYTIEEARAMAVRNRPEIRQAELQHLQATQDLRSKKAEYIPDVSAEFNSLNFLNWGRYIPTQSVSVGVSLSWEPFDWGRRKHEAAQKQRTVDQAKLAQTEAESQVVIDVNDKHRQLRYRQAELRVVQLAQQTAIENLRVAKNKFAVQAMLVKDILQAQVSLEQSNADYQQALTTFWNARADFERALGEDQ